jgi:type III secretory pathway component EscU
MQVSKVVVEISKIVVHNKVAALTEVRKVKHRRHLKHPVLATVDQLYLPITVAVVQVVVVALTVVLKAVVVLIVALKVVAVTGQVVVTTVLLHAETTKK